jgi:hypothetical protein
MPQYYHSTTQKSKKYRKGGTTILMQQSSSIPDLVVNICPLGCDGTCARIWINESIGHKIICNCQCGHKKITAALAQKVVGPEEANASRAKPEQQGPPARGDVELD